MNTAGLESVLGKRGQGLWDQAAIVALSARPPVRSAPMTRVRRVVRDGIRNSESREARLVRVYDEMLEWARRRDPLVARRRVDVVDLGRDVHRRRSARRRAGAALRGQLAHAGRCGGRRGSPPHAGAARRRYTVALPTQATHGGRSSDRVHDRPVPVLPGVRRPPRPAEVADALATAFLEREFAILRPRVVLLLGATSSGRSIRTCWTFPASAARRLLRTRSHPGHAAVRHTRGRRSCRSCIPVAPAPRTPRGYAPPVRTSRASRRCRRSAERSPPSVTGVALRRAAWP
jgi:hypothetical protein